MTCSVCGTRNDPNASFCSRCGSPLTPDAVTGPTRRLHDDGSVGSATPRPPLGGYTVVPQQSVGALVALVLGVVSLLLLMLPGSSLVTAIPAIIVGRKAREEIRSSGGQVTGDGMAQTGIVLGWTTIGLVVLGFALFCMLFALPFAFFPFAR